jgi:hypothetical protein
MKLTQEEFWGVCFEVCALNREDSDLLHSALVAREKQPKGVHEFIARYCEVWKERYGVNPPMNGRATGAAKRIVKDNGLPRSIELVEKYLTMNEAFFMSRRHDLCTFDSNLNTIVAGNTLTRANIQAVERRSNVRGQLDRIKKGTL